MGSIKPPRRDGKAPRHDTLDKFEGLFYARIQRERVEFATLSAALARTEEGPGSIFDDLHRRAHRLRGTAATFDFTELAAAAGALERAAAEAADIDAGHADEKVWAALVALVQMLGTMDDDPLAAERAACTAQASPINTPPITG